MPTVQATRPADLDITGCGVVSAAGMNLADFSATIFSGQSAISDIRDLFPQSPIIHGAPMRQYVPADHFDRRTEMQLDPVSQYAVVAARQAWAQAGLAAHSVPAERIAVIIGTANGGTLALEINFRRYLAENKRPLPMAIPMAMGCAPASWVAREVGAKGPVLGISSACASGAHAIAIGEQMIRAGLVDIAVVGGAEAGFTNVNLAAWSSLKVADPEPCRPFSAGRRGLTLGEGAGIIILENRAHAAGRAATVHARLMGSGMCSDAGDLLAPDTDSMISAMRLAITAGRLEPEQIDYINAHGTGTIANDRSEAQAIDHLFGHRAEPVAVSSTKGSIGHTLGAAGALEAIISIEAIKRELVPPTLNYSGPDPECPIDPTPLHPRPLPMRTVLSNSFAFGGLYVSLLIGQAQTLPSPTGAGQ